MLKPSELVCNCSHRCLNNLLQVGPSLFYLMALRFFQTMITATCSTLSMYLRGVTRVWQEGTIPRAPNHCGGGVGAKSSNNITSTFFNTVNLLPKELRFEHGSAKLASCPGRHLTSSCSLAWALQKMRRYNIHTSTAFFFLWNF